MHNNWMNIFFPRILWDIRKRKEFLRVLQRTSILVQNSTQVKYEVISHDRWCFLLLWITRCRSFHCVIVCLKEDIKKGNEEQIKLKSKNKKKGFFFYPPPYSIRCETQFLSVMDDKLGLRFWSEESRPVYGVLNF